MSKFSIIADFIRFLMQRKKYWLIPMVLVFLLIGVLLIVTQSSVVAPFIYTLF